MIRARSLLFIVLGALAALLLASGCSSARATPGASPTDAGTIPEECERYLTQYSHCMLHLGQPTAAVEGRVASARESFAQSADKAGLTARCSSDLSQLHTACP